MISEEKLMAYADGELSAEDAVEVEAEVAADPALKAKVEKHRRLRVKLAGAFQGVIEERTPQRLSAAVEGRSHMSAELVDLEAVRHAKEALKQAERPKRPAWAPWALAAGIAAVGLIVAAPLFLKAPLTPQGQQLLAANAGGMTAGAPLARALDRELASDPKPGERIAIGLTFKDHSGAWCRSFTSEGDGLAGLACRNGARWRVEVVAASPHAARKEFQVAGSGAPAAVQAAIAAALAGQPLDAAAERRARDGGWR